MYSVLCDLCEGKGHGDGTEAKVRQGQVGDEDIPGEILSASNKKSSVVCLIFKETNYTLNPLNSQREHDNEDNDDKSVLKNNNKRILMVKTVVVGNGIMIF